MKYTIFFSLLIGINLTLNAQNNQCDKNELLNNIIETVRESDKKISLNKNPYKDEIFYKKYYQNPNNTELSNNTINDTILMSKRREIRLFMISSKKYDNEALLKIFNLNSNKELYSIKDEPDNKPSFIDIKLDETSELRFTIKFKNNKEGCVLWTTGIIID